MRYIVDGMVYFFSAIFLLCCIPGTDHQHGVGGIPPGSGTRRRRKGLSENIMKVPNTFHLSEHHLFSHPRTGITDCVVD